MAWTLQKLIDQRMTLFAWCNACQTGRTLDLTMLRDRLGPDAPAMASDIAPKLRCHRCGGKDVKLTYSPDNRPHGAR